MLYCIATGHMLFISCVNILSESVSFYLVFYGGGGLPNVTLGSVIEGNQFLALSSDNLPSCISTTLVSEQFSLY